MDALVAGRAGKNRGGCYGRHPSSQGADSHGNRRGAKEMELAPWRLLGEGIRCSPARDAPMGRRAGSTDVEGAWRPWEAPVRRRAAAVKKRGACCCA
jgi:hypothetical protein